MIWPVAEQYACLMVRIDEPDTDFRPAEILAVARKEMEERKLPLLQIALYEEDKAFGEGAFAVATMRKDGPRNPEFTRPANREEALQLEYSLGYKVSSALLAREFADDPSGAGERYQGVLLLLEGPVLRVGSGFGSGDGGQPVILFHEKSANSPAITAFLPPSDPFAARIRQGTTVVYQGDARSLFDNAVLCMGRVVGIQ
ncbi:hypothetical protein LJC23_00760 [Desulfovibrio sp. OttesenSCG-928-I05]|nr:hypothetical protein [Desulfovibrio sp. OttesenSCG-928-I05]